MISDNCSLKKFKKQNKTKKQQHRKWERGSKIENSRPLDQTQPNFVKKLSIQNTYVYHSGGPRS